MTWCIELTIFFAFLMSFVFFYKNKVHSDISLFPLLDSISEFRMQLILRNSWFPVEKFTEYRFLFTLLKEAVFQGKSIGTSCEVLAKQILKTEEHRSAKHRFLSMIAFRIAAVLAMSVLARVYLSISFEMQLRDFLNFMCLICSFAVSFLFFLGIYIFYPQSWFVKNPEPWLNALFLHELNEISPIFESWKKMDDQEKTFGISLASTKHALIETWRFKNELEYEDKLRLFEDCVPAAEFVCLGLASLLILGGPIWQIIKF